MSAPSSSEKRDFPTGLAAPTKKPGDNFKVVEESAYLLLAKDEITWMRDKRRPDHQVEYFLNLGCGVQGLPHIMLDSISVLEALGVSFAAGGGRSYCCGNPYRSEELDAANRLTAASSGRMLAWGARTVVHWCTACQLTFGAWGRGADEVWSGGDVWPLAPGQDKGDRYENVHIHEMIANRLAELGDKVQWKKNLNRRVLVEGHPDITDVHDAARTSGARMLAQVPGVEVLGYVDPPSYFKRGPKSNCTNALTDMTEEDITRTRIELAEQAHARGADTVSCQHHNCHRTWSKFASENLAVSQCISIVAEALGVAHVDRYQIAVKMGGGAEAIVAHTRPIWKTWGIDEKEATAIARRLFEPKFADRPSCACGGDVSKCEESLITLG